MNEKLLLLPVLLQVVVTLVAYILLGRAKTIAAKAGLVDETRRGLHDDAWPDAVRQINNNIRNQFELPVLFYVLVLCLWGLAVTGWFVQTVAWLFALSRVLHLYVHVGSNYVPLRRRVFMFGFLMVVLLLGSVVFALFGA